MTTTIWIRSEDLGDEAYTMIDTTITVNYNKSGYVSVSREVMERLLIEARYSPALPEVAAAEIAK